MYVQILMRRLKQTFRGMWMEKFINFRPLKLRIKKLKRSRKAMKSFKLSSLFAVDKCQVRHEQQHCYGERSEVFANVKYKHDNLLIECHVEFSMIFPFN